MSLTTESLGSPEPLPTFTVEPWADPVIDELGVDPRAPYTEKFWLPVLGPSTIWFLRRVADRLDDEPDGFDLDLADLARCLGVGVRGGRNAPILKTVDRCCRFGAARMFGRTGLAVRRRLAPLNLAQIDRLPEHLRVEHAEWLARPHAPSMGEHLREKARRLALSLLELGESPEACERQLHHWRFHPAIAFDAVRWARATHEARRDAPDAVPTEPPSTAPAASPRVAAHRHAGGPAARLAAPVSGTPLPDPVPTVAPPPGERSTRPPLPRTAPSRSSAAGGSTTEQDPPASGSAVPGDRAPAAPGD